MWNDVETTDDFLNFTTVSDTVAELIVESEGKPISIGISGSWGVGKSSLVKMVGESLKKHHGNKNAKDNDYVFLEFNAWLYQGYDDAKAALLQSVVDKLSSVPIEQGKVSQIKNNIKNFAKRVNWFQLAKLASPLALGLIPGAAPVGGIMALFSAFTGLLNNDDGSEKSVSNSESLQKALNDLTPEIKALVKENVASSVPRQIESLRSEFAKLLKELGVTLVVLVDDLDRCLPETAVSTLEAMRLLLFVEHTAFIIAADEDMIRSSVKAHFSNIDMKDGLVTNYFDKLIQVPIRVPRLGEAEVKVYLMSLFAQATAKSEPLKNPFVHSGVISQLEVRI